MAQYIDADKLWNDRPQVTPEKSLDYKAGFSECMWAFSKLIREQIDNSASDVVPKSEVAKEFTCFVGDPHKVDHCPYLDEIEKAKNEVAREIIDDILSKIRTMIKEIEKVERCDNSYYSEFNGGSKTALEIVFKDIAELKKKYTE